jgi:hypothetical protein
VEVQFVLDQNADLDLYSTNAARHIILILTQQVFYQRIVSDAENYWSVWRQTHYEVTDQNNNVSFEGLYKHHSLYWYGTNEFVITNE